MGRLFVRDLRFEGLARAAGRVGIDGLELLLRRGDTVSTVSVEQLLRNHILLEELVSRQAREIESLQSVQAMILARLNLSEERLESMWYAPGMPGMRAAEGDFSASARELNPPLATPCYRPVKMDVSPTIEVLDYLEGRPVGRDEKLQLGAPPAYTSQGGYSLRAEDDAEHLLSLVAHPDVVLGKALRFTSERYAPVDDPDSDRPVAHLVAAMGFGQGDWGLGERGDLRASSEAISVGLTSDAGSALEAIAAHVRRGTIMAGEVRDVRGSGGSESFRVTIWGDRGISAFDGCDAVMHMTCRGASATSVATGAATSAGAASATSVATGAGSGTASATGAGAGTASATGLSASD